MSKKYGIQCAPLTGVIHAGEINPEGTAFTDKQDVTSEAMWAVSDWSLRHWAGKARLTFKGGRVMDITVYDDEEADQ